MSRWGSLPPWSRRTWGRAAGAAVIPHPVGRAADELAATGATARPRRRLASEPLTSQETRVALLVARGLSNCEVAAALFLSPKTVERHLASVFRKRGFRSRTELTSALARAAVKELRRLEFS